jgi:DNA-binding transcriptional ArsR family regulator
MNGESGSKVDLMLHPVRLRILLALVGTEQTATAIARSLSDVPASSLYRHLQKLIAAGLVEVVAERQVRGAVEKTLRVATGAALLAPEESALLSADDHRQAALIFVTQLLYDFDRYLRRPGFDLLRDLAGLRMATLYATDEEWRAALTALNAALLPLLNNGPGAGRIARRLATISFPVPEEPEPSEEKETAV